MVAYVKVSVVRKSLANCGVRVRLPLEVPVHNCFCFTHIVYPPFLKNYVIPHHSNKSGEVFLHLLTKLICVFHIILLPLYCN